MGGLEAVAGVVVVGALTPGPNNLVVMRTAAREGLFRAMPAMAGVVLGSLALLAVSVVGGSALFRAIPHSRFALAVCGCLYLGWLGLALALRAHRAPEESEAGPSSLPAGVAGLFAFQFLNPKGWVMTLTAVSTFGAGGMLATFGRLVPLFVVIPAVCLTLWCSLGAALTRALHTPRVRTWFDRATGCLLLGFALLLLLEA